MTVAAKGVLSSEYLVSVVWLSMRRVRGWRTVLISVVSMLIFNVLMWHVLGLATLPGNSFLNSFFWLREVLFYSYYFFGIAQFLYVVPICFWLMDRRRFGMGRFSIIKGILLGALLTVVLNGLLIASLPAHIGIG